MRKTFRDSNGRVRRVRGAARRLDEDRVIVATQRAAARRRLDELERLARQERDAETVKQLVAFAESDEGKALVAELRRIDGDREVLPVKLDTTNKD